MSGIYRALFFLVVLPWLSGSLVAETDDEQPTPKTPLIPRAPQMAAWTITYTYKSPPPAKAAAGATNPAPTPAYVPEHLISLQVVKTGTIYHLTSTYSTGRKNESWIIGGRELTQMPEGPLFLRLSNGLRYDDFTRSDFPELSWLTEDTYTGLKKKGELTVFVFGSNNSKRPLTLQENIEFVMGTAVATPLGATPEQIKALQKKAAETFKASRYGDTQSTVLLDATTQLPVEWDDGKIDRIYQFTTPPTDNLVPPPEVVAEFKAWFQEVPR